MARTLIGAKFIESIERADGKAVVEFYRRDDRCYVFRGYEERADEQGLYQAPTEHSGIYDSFEHAREDAKDLIPWLREPTEEQRDAD